MDGYLRQATAAQTRTIGPFVDDTDFKSLENALTIANTDIKIKKNGGASASKNSGGATADGAGGLYAVTWDATDTATVGELAGTAFVAGALPCAFKYVVLEEAVYDAMFVASAPGYVVDQPVNLTKILGTTAATPATAGILDVNVKNLNNVSGSAITTVKAVQGLAVDGVIPTATNLTNAPTNGDLTAAMKASVNAEALDVLNVDTYAEPGQEAPGATVTLAKKISYLYKNFRNKKTQTATTYSLFADDASTVDQKATVSDDATTATRGEIASGP